MSTHRKRWVSGCLTLLAAAVVLFAAFAGWIWWSTRSTNPQTSTLVREVVESRAPVAEAVVVADPLVLTLELDGCEVYLEPGAPGEPLDVEANYDADDYRLEEITDASNPGAYGVRFVMTSSRFLTAVKQGLRGGQPQLRIRLPVDVPVELKLVQRNGGAYLDLGGLHLTAVDLDVEGAVLKVDADTPLRGDLERLDVKGRQGAVLLESVNLMRPRHMAVDFHMGQAHLDLRGPWSTDAEIDLSLSVLDTVIRLPRDVRIEGLDEVPAPVRPTGELPLPTLTFKVDSGARTQLRVFE